MPCETFRAYVVGIWVIIGAGVNQFFSVRQPPVSISTYMLQMLMLPTGRLLEYILPKKEVNLLVFNFHLNPGP